MRFIDQDDSRADVARLADNKVKGLWLIDACKEPETFHRWTFLPFDQPGVNQFGYRAEYLKPPMFASDFSILTTLEQIMQRIKQYAPVSQRQHRLGQSNVASVYIPRVMLQPFKEIDGTHYMLTVPIDSQLPLTARRLIESPADFVSAKDAKDFHTLDTLRVAGIKLLGSMKTQTSIQLLQDCLDDSVVPFKHSRSSIQIRTGAYEQLLRWRIDPPKPAFASKVTRLFLNDTKINDDTLTLVSEFENLESLWLSGAKITKLGIGRLAGLKKLNHLQLNDDVVTDDILQTLASNDQLHVLDPATTEDESARPSSADDVAKLSFWYSPFTDTGFKQFRQCKNLPHIGLGRMKITDAAIADLSQFKSLKFLTLGETSITKEGFAKLRMALPDCSIDSQ